MADEPKFWLHDGEEHYALVTGEAERDRLSPLGWTLADEPTDGWVHIWREGIEQPGLVPVSALETLWGPNSWVAGPPPGGLHPAAPKPSAAAESKSSKSAAGGSVKE